MKRVGIFFAIFLFAGFARASDEQWVDPSRISYFLSSFSTLPPGTVDNFTARIEGLSVVQGETSSEISIYFKSAFYYQTASREQASSRDVYGIRFPKVLKFRLSMNDGVARVDRLDEKNHRCVLRVKMPFFVPDNAYVKSVSFDLLTSKARLELGVVGDVLGWVTELQLSEGTDPRVKWLDTAAENAVRAAEFLFRTLAVFGGL